MNKNLTATILIILAVGVYLTVTKGIIAKGQAAKTANEQYASAIETAKKLVSVRDQVEKDYDNISENDRERLDKMIPTTVDNIRLVIDLNSVALNHGFQLSGVKAAATQSASAAAPASRQAPTVTGVGVANASTEIVAPVLDTVDVSFSITAPYLDFISFLQDIEANLRIMDVTHLTVSGSDNGIYTFGVTLKTYWLRSQ